jgi:hypothetical protein
MSFDFQVVFRSTHAKEAEIYEKEVAGVHKLVVTPRRNCVARDNRRNRFKAMLRASV